MAQRTFNTVTTWSDFTTFDTAPNPGGPGTLHKVPVGTADDFDGVIVPIFDESKRNRLSYNTLDIASVTNVPVFGKVHSHNQWQIVFTAPHGLRNGDKLNFTSTDPNASPFVPGTITIQNVDRVINDTTVVIRTSKDLSGAVAATTGASRYGSTITLGLATFIFGDAGENGWDAVDPVRIGLILTDADRADGSILSPEATSFEARKASGELIWSRVYQKGSTVSVDFGGYSVGAGYQMPYVQSQEKVLQLVAYSVQDGVTEGFTLSTELTYQIQTVIED